MNNSQEKTTVFQKFLSLLSYETYEKHSKLYNFISILILWGVIYLLLPRFSSEFNASRTWECITALVIAICVGLWLMPIFFAALGAFGMFLSSPIFQRRWRKFKSLKRGYYSFIIIISLFVMSFFAEFLINGNAIMVKYKGKVKFTLFATTRAKDFGMKGYGSPNYRAMKELYIKNNSERAKRISEGKATEEDKAYAEWGDDWVLMPIYPYGDVESLLNELPCRPPHPPTWAKGSWRDCFFEENMFVIPENRPTAEELKSMGGDPEWAKYDDPKLYYSMAIAGLLKLKEGVSEPTSCHLLGTDDRGRDVFARMIYGFRISMAFALIVTLFSYMIGIAVGACLGYYGGKFDIVVQRIVEIWSAMPFLYTVMIFAAIMIPNFWMLVGILVMFGWMGMTYYIRAEFLREKSKDYVLAARAIGCTDSTIIFKHILPNALTPVISFAPFAVVANIGSLVSLDFLGFGLPAPTSSWGELLGQGLGNLTKPWLIFSPTIAMFLTLLLVSFIGEAIREAFDPKQYSRLR